MSNPIRVVCLGGGYVAMWLTKALRNAIIYKKVEMIVISRDNYHTYHGFIAEMLTGKIQPSQVASPARRIFEPAYFYNAEIENIDIIKQVITTSRSLDGRQYEVSYDHLVISLGSVDDLSRYPGIAEHAMKLKSFNDCYKIRNHIIQMLELAEIETDTEERSRLLTFVVAGGNYGGIEVATELADHFRLLIKKEYRQIAPDEIKVIVIHSGERILSELVLRFPELVRYAENFLHDEFSNLEIITNTRIVAATPEEAILSNGERISTRTIISCTGTAQSPLLDKLPLERDKYGKIITDEFVRVKGTNNVWAGGDCAAVPLPTGGTCPPLAIYALTCGYQIGGNILRSIESRKLKAYKFTGLGDAVSLGNRHAIAHLKGVPLYGFNAWVAWRIALFIFVPSWERKLRLLVDWSMWPFLGRDIISMKLQEKQSLKQAYFQAGQVIVKQGDIGRCLYLIRNGEVEVLEEMSNGEIIIQTLGSGEHFGEKSVIKNSPHIATVRAKTSVQLVVIDREEALLLSNSLSAFNDTNRLLSSDTIVKENIDEYHAIASDIPRGSIAPVNSVMSATLEAAPWQELPSKAPGRIGSSRILTRSESSQPSKFGSLGLASVATLVALSSATTYLLTSKKVTTPEPKGNAIASQKLEVIALGRLEPAGEIISVAGPVGERIGYLEVAEGDNVKNGQILAYLENYNERLQTRNLAAAKVREIQEQIKTDTLLRQVEAEKSQSEIEQVNTPQLLQIKSQQALIRKAEVELSEAIKTRDRFQYLSQEGAIAKQDFDNKQLIVRQAEENLNQAKATLEQLAQARSSNIRTAQTAFKASQVNLARVDSHSGLEPAKNNLALRQAQLERSIIRAPQDGKVLKVFAHTGEAISQKSILQLGNTQQMFAVAEVYETDVSKVKFGQEAVITSPVFTKPIKGTVDKVGNLVFKNNIIGDDPTAEKDARIVEVKIRLQQSEQVANFSNLQVDVRIQLNNIGKIGAKP
ncbi:FAD-dependent oxidoreductase [Nostoc punctiforme UO1]|uniref:FAD-dependent oxidoreductase n=1 Tax=Nostoc punctiforme TaxID=272131 RepID=UPI0030973101